MTLQASGAISFKDIKNEFGIPPGQNLGAYRLNGGITVSGLESLALDNEVNSVGIITPLMPQSGTIKFSDFYGKKLNVVIDYTVGTGYATRADNSTARGKYENNSGRTVIGFGIKNEAPIGTKIWIHTNGYVGSDRAASTTNTLYCSLLTGTWDPTTDLRLDIGPSGGIYGAGGKGGKGANVTGLSVQVGSGGENGNSALGIQHTPIIITNRGKIVAGGGGGGGGGSGASNRRTKGWGNGANKFFYATSPGAGGGGGIGLPGGTKGDGGAARYDFGKFDSWNSGGGRSTVYYGNAGNDGTTESGGDGGSGTTYYDSGINATGGTGGDAGVPPAVGETGGTSSAQRRAGGGGGGSPGYAIIISNNGSGVTIKESGTTTGSILYNTNPG